ncbi:MAG: MerR family transcriptional regulator [Coriobacteriia bacterium]|nr:MerR family transcriptional regulator [Coriobacteriia bacterium]
MSDATYLTISEVVAHLAPEYPDLAVSKLRYLEDEGLVTPDRTPSGYRKYSREHVERIRTILLWQSENFLPLSIIRERLDDLDEAGETQAAETDLADQYREDMQSRLLLVNIHTELGITDSFIRELAEYSIITVQSGRSGDYLDGNDAQIAREAWELKSYGVEPRHLKTLYANFSHKEADYYYQILAPTYHIRTEVSAKRLAEALREIGGLTASLKARLASKALHERMQGLL